MGLVREQARLCLLARSRGVLVQILVLIRAMERELVAFPGGHLRGKQWWLWGR